MSTRSTSSNLFSPLRDPESLIRRRNLGEPSSLFDFEEVMSIPHNNMGPPPAGPPPPNNNGLPPMVRPNEQAPRSMEELCQPSIDGRGGPIAPILIQATDFGLRHHMIQQVQNTCQFHGLPGDDANRHIDKFLEITQHMKQNGVSDDALRLSLFPYSLTHHAIAWYDRLPRNSIHSFDDMMRKFLSKYFPPSMVTKLRNEITKFEQKPHESLFEAWERYKLSIDRCPNHNMLLVTQIDTFYNGLTLSHRDTINAAAGGTFMQKTPEECYELIENMTAHHNHWDTSATRDETSRNISSTTLYMIILINLVMSDSEESGITHTTARSSCTTLSRLCAWPEEPVAGTSSPRLFPGPELADDEIVVGDQPHAEDASPMAHSPDEVPESDPEADPEEDDDEDPEEDPIDYSADGGDDGDDEMDIEEDEDDDMDIETDEEDEDDEMSRILEERGGAPSSCAYPATPPPHPAYRMTARISIPEPLPVPAWTDSEVPGMMGFEVRARLALLLLDQLEVLEQITALLPLWTGLVRRDPERYVGYGITDSWDEIVETLQGAPVSTDTELGAHMREFESLVRRDTDEIYTSSWRRASKMSERLGDEPWRMRAIVLQGGVIGVISLGPVLCTDGGESQSYSQRIVGGREPSADCSDLDCCTGHYSRVIGSHFRDWSPHWQGQVNRLTGKGDDIAGDSGLTTLQGEQGPLEVLH
ncbi:reverse transcriptase domain-containing protein [Tanacetum coccineum]